MSSGASTESAIAGFTMKRCGLGRLLPAILPFMAAVQAVHDTLKALRAGTPPAELAGLAPAELMKQVTRDQDYRRWTKDFLGGD